MAKLELFATQHCWVCSACGQKFDALWRPSDKPYKPLKRDMWSTDKPVFRYCPMCGEEFEREESEEIKTQY